MRAPLVAICLLLTACAAGSASMSLDGSKWTRVGSSDVTLNFADGTASGFAGCNQYRGPYTSSGSSLTFGPLISTKRACAEAEKNQQETAYLAALANTASYEIAGDRLTLRDAAGATLLEFTRR